jgi:hypothetical protein
MLNVPKPTTQTQKPRHELIAECAYSIWEKEGRPNGRELTHWLQAEAQLSKRTSTGTTASKAVTPVQQPRTTTKQPALIQTTLTPGAARQGTTVTRGQRN